jgi:DegV family protein with EDD domain
MEYLTQNELKKMLLLSYERIEREKEEINKINIFPVPDQDTGSNMAKTLLGIKNTIERKEFNDLSEISKAALDGALTAAQGNAGVIYVGFLAGFLPLLDKNPVDAKKLAIAFEEGQKRAWKSIQNPKEGTILDVIDATTEVFKEESKREKNIINILKKATEKAKKALLATREKMEIFRKANVVDAGGLGFLMIMESYLEALELVFVETPAGGEKPSEKVRKFVQILANRYEVVSLIGNPKFEEKEIQEKLKKLGDSIDIVKIANKMKIHIHTDYPEEVRDALSKSGKIEDLRIEDMAKEVVGEPSVRKVSIGIVTEDITSLLPKILERYQIELAYAILDWPELEKFSGENIYQKIREAWKLGSKTLPKTSQATPKSYFDAYKKQLQRFDKVLGLTISSKISGCYNSAIQAREMLTENEKERVYVLDTLNGAAGEALLVLRAIELIQEQREMIEILDELKILIPKIHLYLMFEDPQGIESIGRITKSQANWVRRMKKLGIHPIMEIKNGVFGRGGIIFAKDMSEALFKKIVKESKKIRAKGKKIRVIINQADNLEGAEKLKTLLKKEFGVEVSFISEGPPIICAALGPGSLIVAWQPI